MNYYIYESDFAINLDNNEITILKKRTEDWIVTVLDTGRDSSISERILAARAYVGDNDFILAYGDCISNIAIDQMVHRHKESGCAATIAVAKPTGRNALLALATNGNLLSQDMEKDISGSAWVNAYNMVFSPKIFLYLKYKENFLERGLFERLAKDQQITTYQHTGFWSSIETRRDLFELELAWREQRPAWKVWKD